MTVWAQREGARMAKISFTYGQLRAEITEDYGHLKSFHKHLGRIISEIDAEQPQPQPDAAGGGARGGVGM